MSNKSPDPSKQNITGSAEAASTIKKPAEGMPAEELPEDQLAKASGGRGAFNAKVVAHHLPSLKVDVHGKIGHLAPGSEPFVKISGPSWVNLMAYRKAGWEAEPKEKRSIVALHDQLLAESGDD